MKLALVFSIISLAVGTSALDDARIQRNLRLVEKAGGKRGTGGRFLVDVDGSMSMSMANMLIGDPPPMSSSKSSKSSKKTPMFPLEAEFSIEYSGCDYHLTFSFVHDVNLPVPSSPMEQCNPRRTPVIAPDGIPYLAFREFLIPFSEEIYNEIGIAEMSLDFQSCGHPPLGSFNKPHYDMHFYYDPLEIREKRTCATFQNTPVCDFTTEQSSAAGRAFFNVNTIWTPAEEQASEASQQVANMPPGFTCGVRDAIPLSGIHCWDVPNTPNVDDWNEPILILGSYGGKFAFFEPMTPIDFVTGPEAKEYNSGDISYAGQTIESLPEKYTVSYAGETAMMEPGRTTISLQGKRKNCESL